MDRTFRPSAATLTKRLTLAGICTLCSITSVASASEGVSLVWEPIKLDKTSTVNGHTTHQLVDPSVTHDKVVPGSHLIVVGDYRNASAKPATDLMVVNPVPKALMLSDDGFGSFEVSANSGKTFGRLGTLTFVDAKGNKRPVQAADVTALRWVVARINPGGSGKLEYHAIVR